MYEAHHNRGKKWKVWKLFQNDSTHILHRRFISTVKILKEFTRKTDKIFEWTIIWKVEIIAETLRVVQSGKYSKHFFTRRIYYTNVHFAFLYTNIPSQECTKRQAKVGSFKFELLKLIKKINHKQITNNNFKIEVFRTYT